MKARRSRRSRWKRPGAAASGRLTEEWAGGTVLAPFHIHDRPEPYRPELALWVQLPEGIIVGYGVLVPEEDDGHGLARALREAMAAPMVGEPRQPDAIRVADAAAAAEVEAEVAGMIPVTIGPTAELDALFKDVVEAMAKAAPDDEVEPSYLWDGLIPIPKVAALFDAARALCALRPWEIDAEPPVLRMDIPALDVDGACVTIVGQTGDVRGVLVFPSADHFESFLIASEEERYKQGDIGSEVLVLTFESAAKLPASMRREVMKHGWSVLDPTAYPVVERRDADAVPAPPALLDVEIATACATALVAFLSRHAESLDVLELEPVSETYTFKDDTKVRLTAPYESLEGFEPDFLRDDNFPPDDDFGELKPFHDDRPFMPQAGRNDPCPCGSGRKYKKCHLPEEEARRAEHQKAIRRHRMDADLVSRLTEFAAREFPEAWRRLQRDMDRGKSAEFFTVPMSVYFFEVEGTTVAEAYLAAFGKRCSSEERRWLQAQGRAWLSVWEVEAVDPGSSLNLHDLISGESRYVRETKASEVLDLRDTILARIVDYDGMSLLCSIHPNLLPPLNAAEAVDRARGRLGRKRATVDRLRTADIGRSLLSYWEEAVEEHRLRRSQPREVRNQDGDPLLQTMDRFDFEAEETEAIRRLIGTLEGAKEAREEELEEEDDVAMYAFLRPDDTLPEGRQTVVGWARLAAGVLRTETNSENRANALRQRLEAVCGNRIQHRKREHVDLLSDLDTHPGQPAAVPSPEDLRLAAEHKASHYAKWPDMPLPALDGRTPRECARTADGREEVNRLLKHMENQEQRAAVGRPFDFTVIRDELGISRR